MIRSKIALATATLVTLLAAGAAQAHEPKSFQALLSGANEVGVVGDADGFGTALLTIDYHTGQIDYEISFGNLSNVTAAHIHMAPAGSNGPVVVNFGAPAGTPGNGVLKGSVVDTDAFNITELTASNFYVNLHSSTNPGGAIRGQLTLAPVPEPETYALMLAGLSAVGFAVRRRRAVNSGNQR